MHINCKLKFVQETHSLSKKLSFCRIANLPQAVDLFDGALTSCMVTTFNFKTAKCHLNNQTVWNKISSDSFWAKVWTTFKSTGLNLSSFNRWNQPKCSFKTIQAATQLNLEQLNEMNLQFMRSCNTIQQKLADSGLSWNHFEHLERKS